MKQIILLLLIFFNHSYSFAQSKVSSNIEISSFIQGRSLEDLLGGSKGNTYKGTPYHKPEYVIGSVYKDDKLLSDNIALRYNIFSDEIEVKQSLESTDSKAQMLKKSSDLFVQINGDIFYYFPSNNVIGKEGYVQVLAEGQSINLYKKVIKKFVKEKKPTGASPRGKFAYFKDKITYYIQNKDGKFYEVPTSKKKILKLFNNTDGNLNKFIKKNKINFNKEKDLKKFINFYNTL